MSGPRQSVPPVPRGWRSSPARARGGLARKGCRRCVSRHAGRRRPRGPSAREQQTRTENLPQVDDAWVLRSEVVQSLRRIANRCYPVRQSTWPFKPRVVGSIPRRLIFRQASGDGPCRGSPLGFGALVRGPRAGRRRQAARLASVGERGERTVSGRAPPMFGDGPHSGARSSHSQTRSIISAKPGRR